MKIITGTTGSPHITPLQDSMWHRALTVVDSCVLNFDNNFEPQIMTNNLVRVKSGICSLQGRFMCIEPNTYDEVTIDNGSQGMQRIDIICGKITIDNQGKSTATLEVIKGTPAASNPQPPTIPTGNLDDGDTEAYIPLVKITLNGINITTATMIGEVYQHSAKKLLWENAAPTSSFPSQTISEDLSNYDYIEIMSLYGIANQAIVNDIKIPVGKKGFVQSTYDTRTGSEYARFIEREITVNTSGITIANAYYKLANNQNASEGNTFAIPYRIYAIKEA